MPTNQSPTPRTARILLAATILGSSVAFLDGTVVNLALDLFDGLQPARYSQGHLRDGFSSSRRRVESN